MTLGLGISHGLLVAPNPPCPPYRSTVLPFPPSRKPFLHEIPARTPVRAERRLSPVFEATRRPPLPGDNRARVARTSPVRNQRSKHVGAVDLPDSVGEDGIGSLVTEETIDGVGG